MPYDYLIPTILFFLVLSGCLYHIYKYLPRGLIVLVILCIALIPKYAAITSPYYGTENEDAFVYQADSKSLADHSTKTDPFRTQLAEYNIDKNEIELKSYTGHFTSFSALVWLGNRTFGYSRIRAIELNFLFSALMFIVLYLTVYVGSDNKYGALISILILASSPAINLFQTGGMAETYSSLMVATFLYFSIRFWKNQKISHPDTLFLIASLLMCLLIKRENMVLLSLLPLIGHRLAAQKSFWWISFLGVALCLYFFFVKPFSTEFLEASAIKTSTFSFSYLLVQLPTYITAFFKPQLYGVAFWTLCVLIIILVHNRSLPTPTSLVVLGVFLCYLTIYCLHYRSRYFVLSMELNDFETFRYANNFFYLIPLFIGLNFRSIENAWQTKSGTKVIIGFFIVIFGISIHFSQAMRTDLQSEEFQTRILPLLIANKLIGEKSGFKNNPVLVTDLPVIAAMLDENEFNVFVQELQPGHDYFQYKDKDRLYFLLPRELANEHFDSQILPKEIPLNINTHFVFYQLP